MRSINLLPREGRRDRRGRGALVLTVLIVLLYLGALGAAVVWWEGRVGDARDDVARQEQVNRTLEREVAALQPFDEIRAQYVERADFVRSALASDVDWGLLLTDLSRLIPPRVWVETFSGTVSGTTTPGAMGRVAFTGVGFDFPDVSAWLRSLDSTQFRGVTGTWVSSIVRSSIGDNEVVGFNSTTILTPDAATGRADRLIPEIP